MPYSTKQAVSTASCGGKAGLSVWGGGGGRRGELGEWPAAITKHAASTAPVLTQRVVQPHSQHITS